MNIAAMIAYQAVVQSAVRTSVDSMKKKQKEREEKENKESQGKEKGEK